MLTFALFAKRIVAERKDLALSLLHSVSLFAYPSARKRSDAPTPFYNSFAYLLKIMWGRSIAR